MVSHDMKSCPVVPSDMSTLKSVGTGVTDRSVAPMMEPIFAMMTLCPAASPLAKPAELMTATAGDEELQSTLLVTSLINPLAEMPVAVNC
jgi:hypothetical protein